jgi:predicted acylesterase/phospholipase RssA
MTSTGALTPPDATRYSAFLRLATGGAHRVVVSFGGGALPGIAGNLGLAHLLEQLGVVPHVEAVWGTSAGAVVGGGWASGASAEDVLHTVQTLDRRGSVDIKWARLALSLLLRPLGRPLPDGIVEGRAFARALEDGLRAKTFEECPIPFRCLAVADDGTFRRKVFRTGPLLPAIFSSMALPGLVVPMRDESGIGYYDGGLVEKTPLMSPITEHAGRGDPRKLLLICTHFDNESNKIAARGFLARFLQTLYSMEEIVWRYQIQEAHQRQDVTLVLLNPKLDDRSLFDFSRVADNMSIAHRHFADALSNGKLGLTLGGTI